VSRAVIVSAARTPIARAYRGAYNNTPPQHLAGHVIAAAVERAGIDHTDIDDVILGAALQQGATGGNIARQSALRSGLPVTVPGMSVDRQCASGLMAIAVAGAQIVHGDLRIAVAGGVESVSLVQNEHMNTHRAVDPWLKENIPDIYLPMLNTAEIVAERYGVTREAQDAYALISQQRTAAAQQADLFAEEIVPLASVQAVVDRQSGDITFRDVFLDRDEGNRPSTTLDDLSALRPVLADGAASAISTVTAGNASQLSDGAAATVMMAEDEAARRGVEPRRGRRPGRDGHRAGAGGLGIAAPRGIDGRRYRPLGVERGVRIAGRLLSGRIGHRSTEPQCQRRRDLDRSPVRDVGCAHGRSRAA
jgi:acetyl-CoA C-acetyltransferase